MNVKFLNPFVEAAHEVLRVETEETLKRGELRLDTETYVTDEVTAIISLVGRVVGTVFYSMNNNSAINLASLIMGEKFNKFSSLAQSGIAELGQRDHRPGQHQVGRSRL